MTLLQFSFLRKHYLNFPFEKYLLRTMKYIKFDVQVCKQ